MDVVNTIAITTYLVQEKNISRVRKLLKNNRLRSMKLLSSQEGIQEKGFCVYEMGACLLYYVRIS